MNWTKLLFVVIIVMLYIPMVFLGANVFFNKYTGSNSYYNAGTDCYQKCAQPTDKLTADEQKANQAVVDACVKKQQDDQQAFDRDKNEYDGNKYTFMAIFNLAVLIVALLWTTLNDTLMMGLFLGSVLTTFFATMRYFDTNSKPGFILLVITFFTAVFFINRKRAQLFAWGTTHRK